MFFDADDVVVETNFGGDMCIDVVRQAADWEEAKASARPTTCASRKSRPHVKAMRAEPVSLLYEKRHVLHRPGLDLLEAEMLNFSRDRDRTGDGSPNRLDGAVRAMTRRSNLMMDIPVASMARFITIDDSVSRNSDRELYVRATASLHN